MLIDTAVLGPVEVAEEDIFTLPDGLYGFDSPNQYALITRHEEEVTLRWLQSVESSVPCFVVFDPYEIIDNYAPVLESDDMRRLGCKDVGELRFFSIAVVPDDIQDMTINLKSPVVVNKATRVARQVILANRDYPIKFAFFAPEDEEAGEQ